MNRLETQAKSTEFFGKLSADETYQDLLTKNLTDKTITRKSPEFKQLNIRYWQILEDHYSPPADR